MDKEGANKKKRTAASKPAKAGKTVKRPTAKPAGTAKKAAEKTAEKTAKKASAEEGSAELQLQIRHLLERLKQADARSLSLEQQLRPFHVLADNISDHIYFK